MAKKSIKKAAKKIEKVELTESFNKVKNTAIKVNNQVLATATDVMEDVKVNGKYWVGATTQKVKETIVNIDVETLAKSGVKTATKTVENVNGFALETADEMVDGALKNGKKLQNISAKAIAGSLKIAAKQQDIVFDTLETVKGQLSKSAVRFKKLFKAN